MSFNRPILRLFLLIGLLTAVVSLTACSFRSTFVVINESSDRIQLRYVVRKLRPSDYRSSLPVEPRIKLISELDDDVRWRELSPSVFTFNEETRTAVITLAPNEAVRVEQISDTLCDDKDRKRDAFVIEEISITGASGALRLTGDQVLNSFVTRKKQLCALTYR
ncbi:MAG TPA: hypothetical protein VFS77_18395 [Pyrinomonadaceae bacterium]|nr:hypothetical protein [Pyrinomonadaceae bacterium]